MSIMFLYVSSFFLSLPLAHGVFSKQLSTPLLSLLATQVTDWPNFQALISRVKLNHHQCLQIVAFQSAQ